MRGESWVAYGSNSNKGGIRENRSGSTLRVCDILPLKILREVPEEVVNPKEPEACPALVSRGWWKGK